MSKLQRKKIIIVCISLLVTALAITAFAETIGQKIIRLRREKEQGTSATYSRDKPAETPKKTIKVTPALTNPAEKPDQPKVTKSPEKPALEPKKAALNASDPMTLVPAEALACLRINNFSNAIQNLDKYLAGVLPIPVPLSMMAAPQIGNILGNPMLSGIDLGGNVVVYLNNDMKANDPPIVILIPVTSYDEFTSGNANCSKPDADGISTISPPMAMLGKLVTSKARGGKYAYVTLESQKSYLTKVPGSKISNSLAARMTDNELKLASTAPLWVYGNAEQAVTSFKPMLGMMLKSLPNQQNVDLSAMILNALDQLKSLSITLTPTEKKLALGLSLSAKPGSEIAKALMADPSAKSGFQLAGYLKDKAAMNIALKVNKNLFKIMNDLSVFITESNPMFSAAMPGDMKSLMMQGTEIMGSEAAYSVSTGSGDMPFSFKVISYITDGEKVNAQYDQQMKLINALPDSQGMSMSQTENYSNCKIYTMKIAAPQMAPGGPAVTMNMNMGVSGDKVLVCMGDIAEMKSLVHKTKVRAPRPSGDMATALRIVDNSDEMDFVASLNLLRIISMGAKAASTLPIPQAQMVGGMLSKLNTDSRSCMALAAKVDAGRFDFNIVLPKDHLMEVVGAAMQMMQQMQPQPGPGNSGSYDMTVE